MASQPGHMINHSVPEDCHQEALTACEPRRQSTLADWHSAKSYLMEINPPA